MEIASTVVYLKNRSPKSNLEATPYEAWCNEKPDLSNLKIIGSTVYVHVSKNIRTKLDYNTRKCRLVGYNGTNQWRAWDEGKQDVIVSRDIIFDEDPVPESVETEPEIQKEIAMQPEPKTTEPKTAPPMEEIDSESEESDHESEDDDEERDSTPASTIRVASPPRTSKRTSQGKTAQRFDEEEFDKPKGKSIAKLARILQSVDDNEEPKTFMEAINHPTRSKEWKNAFTEEYNSLIKNKTWKLVRRPKGRNVVTSKWVCKHKKDEFGQIVRFKGRLVARGYTQVYGLDYLDTFAPVAKLASLRIILAIAAVEDLEIHQMDVVAAFLAGHLDEIIYMEQPEGFKQGTDEDDLVCLLEKGLYGLKQSARVWNRKIRRMLKTKGYLQTHSDHCVYVHPKTKVIVAMWVDDLIIAGSNMEKINKLKRELKKAFEMTDMGELKYFLGMQVYRNREEREIHINQSGYTKAMLDKFKLLDSHPVSTPIATGTILRKSTSNDKLMDNPKKYQSLVGSQMYAMLCTRPDLTYEISQISQFNNSPSETHYAVAKRGLRYLNGSIDMGITFSGRLGLKLEMYCDADWGNGEDRKSIGAYIGTLAGGAITWKAKKQSTVAASSTEAEYMALLQTTKESIWIQRLLSELGRTAENAEVIYDDSQGAIALAHNPEHHARTKHIDIQYHFVRDCVESGKIKLEYCPTVDMVADALTKPLAKERHQKLIKRMGLEVRKNTTPSPT